MSVEFGEEVVLRTRVSVQNGLVSGPAAHERRGPGDAADPAIVAVVLSDHLLPADVPVLQDPAGCADSKVVA